jgi:hypothetical protein
VRLTLQRGALAAACGDVLLRNKDRVSSVLPPLAAAMGGVVARVETQGSC